MSKQSEAKSTQAYSAPVPADERALYMRAIESTYPIPDTPHQSVAERAMNNREAFGKGWEQARAALVHQADVRLAQALEVLQMVADELAGTSFSLHKVREGSSDVWRYIGKGEQVKNRVLEVLAHQAAPAQPSAAPNQGPRVSQPQGRQHS